jgi:hypothetical protein
MSQTGRTRQFDRAPATSGLPLPNGHGGLPLASPRQYDLELGEKSGLRIDIDAAAMLFDDDVVAYRQAKPGFGGYPHKA